jgi:hypothetical protein
VPRRLSGCSDVTVIASCFLGQSRSVDDQRKEIRREQLVYEDRVNLLHLNDFLLELKSKDLQST